MRNLIDKLLLIEAKQSVISVSEILSRPGRFEKVIAHIQSGKPFYTQDGTSVILDPSMAEELQTMYGEGTFKGNVKVIDTDGNSWPISSFLKTKDFGGQAVPPGVEREDGEDEGAGKESTLVKPTQIGITDKDFTGATLANAVINNDILNSTPYGKAIIEMARSIINGEPAIIPPDLLKNNTMKTAIVDYAGEYLGVIALVYGHSDFSKKKEFLQWLGGNLQDLTLRFPSKANLAIADSFATLVNPESDHQINISSKGTGGGAAPSLSGLVIPDAVKKKKKYATAVDFIELCQNKNLPKPLTVSQVFLAMNLLQERLPDSIPAEFNEFLPWDQSITARVVDSLKAGTKMPEYEDLWQGIKFKETAADGGKLAYIVKKTVLDLVNDGAIPEFEAAVLEILDYNFIQQYTAVVGKKGELKFTTQWPATLDGVITLESKSSGSDPTKGGFSFKLKPKGSKGESLSPDEAGGTDIAVPNIVTGKRVEIRPTGTKSSGKIKEPSAGRERR